MSGFDTSQPIADEESLKDVESAEKSVTTDDPEADELGDATPEPR
jgi:hypothetical protein